MPEFSDSISRSNCVPGSAPAPANRTAVRILRVNEAPEAAHRLAAELISRQHPTPLLQREATTLPSLGKLCMPHSVAYIMLHYVAENSLSRLFWNGMGFVPHVVTLSGNIL